MKHYINNTYNLIDCFTYIHLSKIPMKQYEEFSKPRSHIANSN